MTTTAPSPAPASSPVPAPSPTPAEETTAVSVPPSADCLADSAGGLTFDVADWRPAAGTAAYLVLVPRDADTATEEVRLPLTPGPEGRLRAVLTASATLAEGRWDVHVAADGAAPQRILPGMNDLRALVDRTPEPGTGPLAVRIPYATKHGNLSLRSWLRADHAEAGDIRVDGGALAVVGRLHRVEDPGTWLAGAVVEARRRSDKQALTVPVTADGDGFAFTLPYADPAASWSGDADVWDLWLRPAEGDPVRIARILDDVADKKPIFTYPARKVDAPHGAAKAVPYYTVDNDLSVRVQAA
ncbi:hypothetical protein ACQUSR_26645 [Streptomyces sp. P1-3]|uniref:hypothetical protein n=1 Tax=Streptomyces sp. P1-3 TaxID=3421658 RepID=UPI003D362277